MIREISQTEKDKYYVLSLACGTHKGQLCKKQSKMLVTKGLGWEWETVTMFKVTNLQEVEI